MPQTALTPSEPAVRVLAGPGPALAFACSSKFTSYVSPLLSCTFHNAFPVSDDLFEEGPFPPLTCRLPGERGVSFAIPMVTPVPSTVHSNTEAA